MIRETILALGTVLVTSFLHRWYKWYSWTVRHSYRAGQWNLRARMMMTGQRDSSKRANDRLVESTQRTIKSTRVVSPEDLDMLYADDELRKRIAAGESMKHDHISLMVQQASRSVHNHIGDGSVFITGATNGMGLSLLRYLVAFWPTNNKWYGSHLDVTSVVRTITRYIDLVSQSSLKPAEQVAVAKRVCAVVSSENLGVDGKVIYLLEILDSIDVNWFNRLRTAMLRQSAVTANKRPPTVTGVCINYLKSYFKSWIFGKPESIANPFLEVASTLVPADMSPFNQSLNPSPKTWNFRKSIVADIRSNVRTRDFATEYDKLSPKAASAMTIANMYSFGVDLYVPRKIYALCRNKESRDIAVTNLVESFGITPKNPYYDTTKDNVWDSVSNHPYFKCLVWVYGDLNDSQVAPIVEKQLKLRGVACGNLTQISEGNVLSDDCPGMAEDAIYPPSHRRLNDILWSVNIETTGTHSLPIIQPGGMDGEYPQPHTYISSIFHCAGTNVKTGVTPLTDQMSTFDINVANFNELLSYFTGQMMIRQRGNVSTIGSQSVWASTPFNCAYAGSKMGLRTLAETLKAELPFLNVTNIEPGWVDTKLICHFMQDFNIVSGSISTNIHKAVQQGIGAEQKVLQNHRTKYFEHNLEDTLDTAADKILGSLGTPIADPETTYDSVPSVPTTDSTDTGSLTKRVSLEQYLQSKADMELGDGDKDGDSVRPSLSRTIKQVFVKAVSKTIVPASDVALSFLLLACGELDLDNGFAHALNITPQMEHSIYMSNHIPNVLKEKLTRAKNVDENY